MKYLCIQITRPIPQLAATEKAHGTRGALSGFVSDPSANLQRKRDAQLRNEGTLSCGKNSGVSVDYPAISVRPETHAAGYIQGLDKVLQNPQEIAMRAVASE